MKRQTSPEQPPAGDLNATATATGAGDGKLLTATVSPNDTQPLVARPATDEAASTSRSARRRAIDDAGPVSDLSEADAVRLVANTAVIARTVVANIQVASARRNGQPGILIWIPGWLWDGKTIVDASSGNSGKGVGE